MTMPDGWTRRVWSAHIEYELEGQTWFKVETGARGLIVNIDDGEVETASQLEAMISVLRRAWRQHEHLKGGAREPLSEEEESQLEPAASHPNSSPEEIASLIVSHLDHTQMAVDPRRPWQDPNTVWIPSAGFLWQRIVDVLSGKPMAEWRKT